METKNILVTGDVICDNHIYEGNRRSPFSTEDVGSYHTSKPGGASLLFQLVANMCENMKIEYPCSVSFGLNMNDSDYPNLPSHLKGYALWKSCKGYKGSDVPKEKPEPIWRMVNAMGYGNKSEDVHEYKGSHAIEEKQNIWILDDADLGYRHRLNEGAWPEPLRTKEPSVNPKADISIKRSYAPECPNGLFIRCHLL